MDKPDFRASDESPSRVDDFKVKVEKYGPVPGFEFEASGKTVTTFIFAAGLIAFGIWHDWKAERGDDRMAIAQTLTASLVATSICVNSLSESEKREYRIEGKYCHDALREVREYLKRQDALPDKRSEFGAAYAAEPPMKELWELTRESLLP